MERACAGFKDAGDAGGQVKCRLELARSYLDHQEAREALNEARLAKAIATETGDRGAEGAAMFYEACALELVVGMDGDPPPADRMDAMYREVDALLRQAVGKIDGERYPKELFFALRDLAQFALADDRVDEAGRWIDQMAGALPPPASEWTNPLRRLQAKLAERRGDEAAAIGHLETLLEELSHFVGMRPRLWNRDALRELGRLYRIVGQDQKAGEAERAAEAIASM